MTNIAKLLNLAGADIEELVAANWSGNAFESAMRLRALTEISRALRTEALMALAAQVGQGETGEEETDKPDPARSAA